MNVAITSWIDPGLPCALFPLFGGGGVPLQKRFREWVTSCGNVFRGVSSSSSSSSSSSVIWKCSAWDMVVDPCGDRRILKEHTYHCEGPPHTYHCEGKGFQRTTICMYGMVCNMYVCKRSICIYHLLSVLLYVCYLLYIVTRFEKKREERKKKSREDWFRAKIYWKSGKCFKCQKAGQQTTACKTHQNT